MKLWAAGGVQAAAPNYGQLVLDLQMLKMLLSRLEAAIAAISLTGDKGRTERGEYLFPAAAGAAADHQRHSAAVAEPAGHRHRSAVQRGH